MRFWIVGTDTDVGKTTVSAWICYHTKYPYWKPVQTGCNISEESATTTTAFHLEGSDSNTVMRLSGTVAYPESYVFRDPLSPHIASVNEGREVVLSNIQIPYSRNLLIEGAGGLMVPMNDKTLYVDFIKGTGLPVILVARTKLGTINHTCLSVEALRTRNIELLGVVMSGEKNADNARSIEKYASVRILGELGYMKKVNKEHIAASSFPVELRDLLESA